MLALVTDAFGAYGGIAQYNRDFLEAVAAMDQLKDVFVLPRIAPEKIGCEQEGLHLMSPTKNKAVYAGRALYHCLREHPDIIYSGHLYHGPLAQRLASMVGAKLVSQLHGTEVWSKIPEKHLRPLEASDVVLCVSRDTRAKYLEQAAPRAANAHVLHNTVREAFMPGNQASARAKFGLKDEFAILTVGRLDPRKGGYKGHERVIRALPNLDREGRTIIYLIAGIGDDRARLERVVKEVGVEDQVRFLGKVPSQDLADLYRAADLFALPSTGEGFGIVFLEAMACGTPAIGLDVGGAGDALLDGELGACVAPADFESVLCRVVCNSSADPEDLAKRVRILFGHDVFNARVCHILMSSNA